MRKFQSWHSSVYRVQCFTCDIAKDITGTTGNVTRVNMSRFGMSQHDLFMDNFDLPLVNTLRFVREYRTPGITAFRNKVAKIAWHIRHNPRN